MTRVIFARVGWMKWYHGPQTDDKKPIGGGSYNKQELGHEAFNFMPLGGYMLGYFQPLIRTGHLSTIALDRIEASFTGAALDGVLAVFVATDPKIRGQRIVGWFRDATVYRDEQPSDAKERNKFSYFLKARAGDAVLIPEARRIFVIPGGKNAFGQANICYTLDTNGQPKNAPWINEALNYVHSYALENIAREPETEADHDIENTVAITIEHGAGFQSDPRIRWAIEDYAMKRAKAYLEKLGNTEDKHKTESYDFLCHVDGGPLYVEVKGTQCDGSSVSLTPKEVEHAQKYKNSALFIVHSVKIDDERKPVISGGKELFLNPWDVSTGTLKPRGFIFTLRK